MQSQLQPKVWLGNLEALYRADAGFAQELDDLPDDANLRVEPAQNGQMTMKVTLPDRKEIFLHSKYNPQNEAKSFVDGLKLEKNFVFVLSGIGLGYQVRELFDRGGKQTVVVVLEPEPGVIRLALWNIDFSAEIKNGRLVFLHRADKGLIHTKLTNIASTMILGTAIEALVYSKLWHSDFHQQMRTFFTEYMYFCRMSFVTLLANCKLTQQNVANNLVSYVCCPPIDNLRGRFARVPAIVVSAGPSLAKNMHLLKEAKGKAVIIAAQTVLKPLLNMGVEPDFVTSLDYNPVSQKFFEGIKDFGNVHLVAEPKVTWSVVDVFTGKKSLLQNEFAQLCLGPLAQKRDGLRAGSTVAHLSLYLAEYIGADPIILIGQDLGFSDNMYYAPGNVVHDMWAVETNRFYTLEMKEWERVVRNRDILRKIKDINGREIYTDEQMFTYLQQFERDFANSPATVIDATQGGARKSNTVIMTLREALDKFAVAKIPADKFDYLQNTKWFDPAPLELLRQQLENRISEVGEFKSLCEKTVVLLKKLGTLLDDPQEFNKLIIQIDEIRSLVNAHMKAMQMVCSVSAMAELRKFTHDKHMAAKDLQGKELAKIQLARDVEYLQALVAGSDELIEVLQGAIKRINEPRP